MPRAMRGSTRPAATSTWAASPATGHGREVDAVDAPAGLKAVAKGNGVVVQAGRDIINGNVFTGSFARLRDVWLDPEPVFDEVQVGQFTGREWLIERIDRFIRRHDRGYVVIQAPAGIGKT